MLTFTKFFAFFLFIAFSSLNAETTLSDLLKKGDYEKARTFMAEQTPEIYEVIPYWIATGQQKEGLKIWQKVMTFSPDDLHGQYAGLELIKLNGLDPNDHIQFLKTQLEQQPLQYRDAKGLVLRGKIALLSGSDASDVMRNYYDVALREEPGQIDALLASAELSLSKGERKSAFETLSEHYEKHRENPEFLHLGYLSMVHDMPKEAEEILEEALEVNPKHVPSLLSKSQIFLKKHDLISADNLLNQILDINPNRAEAWGLKSLVAHIDDDPLLSFEYLVEAFSHWYDHPDVYLTMGETYLSMGRLFDALKSYGDCVEHHPNHTQALLGYSQCLLQTGDLDKAFQIAENIFKQDEYQIRAFNLLELRDQIKDFKTLHKGSLLHLRMPQIDADIYGERALAFIHTALDRWSEKYGLETRSVLHVDFFDRTQDYATRTFGFPQDYGTLGICFGPVITAKTVAAHETPHHLGKILWHEVGHVVTLELSQHKIPRWFTEGISVYEENLLFAKTMNALTPKYKKRILDDQLLKVKSFDSGFHHSDTIGFAYFQAGWMIEHLIELHGFETIKKCVHDLKSTKPNLAFEKHFGNLDELDKSFKEFALKRAHAYAPKADFTPVSFGVELNFVEHRTPWLKDNPNHIEALKLEAKYQKHQKNDKAHLELLQKLEDIYPEDLSKENATLFFADYYKKNKDTKKEIEYLEQYRARDFNHVPSRLRLLELRSKDKNYKEIETLCHELFYLTPLRSEVYENFAELLEHQNKQNEANHYYEKSLILKSKNSSRIHTHLAKQYRSNERNKAMYHILKAIEISPRNREALELYINLKSP